MPEYEALLPGESGNATSVRNLGDSQTDGEWEKIYVKEARVSAGLCATDGTSLVSPSELRQHLDNHPGSGTGGASSFAGLSDTPNNFTGAGGKVAAVKADESGLEFVDAPTSGSSSISDHGLLLGLADDHHLQYYNQTRGDARYAALGHTHGSSELDLSAKADLMHSHTLSEINAAAAEHNHNADYANLSHQHDSQYLAKTNSASFTPTAAYHPATKKYVDDNAGGGAVNFFTGGNMLINPDFKINQRGFAGGAIAAGEYAVDRWGAPAGGASATFAGGAVTLESGKIRQVCEYAVNAGDKLVCSFYAYNAAFAVELHSCDANGNVLASSGQKIIVTGAGKYCQQVFTAPAAGETVAVDIIKTSGSSPTVKQLDLRFGETAPTVWQPPGSNEKQQCLRYYYKATREALNGFHAGCDRGVNITSSLTLPTEMRIQPAVSGFNSGFAVYIYTSSGLVSNIPIGFSGLLSGYVTKNRASLTVDATGGVAFSAVNIIIGSGSSPNAALHFDAEFNLI